MKKWKNSMIIVVCMALLCAMLAGCQSSVLDTQSTPMENIAADSTPQSTAPTQTTDPEQPEIKDDGVRTVRLITEGGMVIDDTHISVYADEALTQFLTTIHTDKEGVATCSGKPGATYYMVIDYRVADRGFVPAPYYTVSEAFTELVLEIKLPTKDRDVKLGDIMCDIDLEDWNGNQFLLSECIAEGKPCIIWGAWTTESGELMSQLQRLYEEYDDRLEILVVTNRIDDRNIKQVWKESGATFPAANVNIYTHRWVGVNEIMVIDRYGRLAMEEMFASTMDQETLQAIADYYTDENYQQDRVFKGTTKMWDYLDSLKYTEEATYRVKVVDGNGNPLAGVGVFVSYRSHSFLEKTDEQGVASWTLQQRDDLIAYLMGDSGSLAPYIIENEGPFAPGSTEKTIIRRDREIVTFTLKTVDIHGNPVAGVQFVKFEDDFQVCYTDENGFAQWEALDVDYSCTVGEDHVPEGYALDSFTREGNTFTALFRPIVTYTVRILKEDGKPFVGANVWLLGSIESDSGYTDGNGIVTLSLPEDHYEVRVDNLLDCDDGEEIWTQKYEIVEGQTEATFIWVDDTVNYKVKVVDKNGNPINKIEVEIWEENMDGYIPTVKTDENGEAIFKARVRQYTIILFIVVADDSAEGGCRVFSYGTFTFSGDETEVVIEVGEPEEVSP